MAVAFPSASAVSLQTPDPSDPSSSMQASGSGAGDPFSALLASASLAPAAAAGELPDAALTTNDATSAWPDAAGDGLPSEQLLGLIAVPALPVLLNPVLDPSGADQEPAAIVSPELAFALGEAAPWPLQGLAGQDAGEPAAPVAGQWFSGRPVSAAVLLAQATWVPAAGPTTLAPAMAPPGIGAEIAGAPAAPAAPAGSPAMPAMIAADLPATQAYASTAATSAAPLAHPGASASWDAAPRAQATHPAPLSTSPAGPATPLAGPPGWQAVPASPVAALPHQQASGSASQPGTGATTLPANGPAVLPAAAPTVPATAAAQPIPPALGTSTLPPAIAAILPATTAPSTTAPAQPSASAPATPATPSGLPGAEAPAPAGAALPSPVDGAETPAATGQPTWSQLAPEAPEAITAPTGTSDEAATTTRAAWLPAALPIAPTRPRAADRAPEALAAQQVDAAADPLRELLLNVQPPIEGRRGWGAAVSITPASAAATTPASDDAQPTGVLGLVATAADEAPAPAPAWQRLAEPGDQRPVASQPLIADAPPPSGIPAAALQMQAAPAAEVRRSTPLDTGSESAGLEALRPTPPAPLESRPVTAEIPVLRASPPTPVDRAIAGQITRQLVHTEANGDRTLVIRLTPAELGTVRIELREHNGTLTAHLRVEDEAVGRAIDRMLPSMRQDLRGQDSPLADVVREPRDQRQGDQRGNGQPQDQSTPWSRQQERDSNRQGRRQAQAQAAFSLAGLVDEGAPLVPSAPAAGLARPLR